MANFFFKCDLLDITINGKKKRKEKKSYALKRVGAIGTQGPLQRHCPVNTFMAWDKDILPEFQMFQFFHYCKLEIM